MEVFKIAEEYNKKHLVGFEGCCWLTNNTPKEAYLDGYREAEKDFALTWEDVHELVVIEDRLIHELSIKDDTLPQSKEFYEEVLHRFNEMRK